MAVDLQQVVFEIRHVLGDGVRAVVLFGSRARGDAFADSDTDVAVFLQPHVAAERRLYLELDRDRLADPGLSVLLIPTADPRPSGMLLEMARGHRVLWEAAAGDVAALLQRLVDEARDRGAVRRVTASGEPYWVGV